MAIALAGLAALAVAMGIGRFAFTPLLPMMQADAGLTLVQGGWLASANYAGYLLGALTAPALRRHGAQAIRAGLALISLTTLAMALDAGLAAWALLRMLAGIASAWVLIHVSAWSLERLAALGRPALAGAVYAGVGAGILFAGALCLLIMRAEAGSRAGWIALGAASLAATGLVWTRFAASSQQPPAGAARPWTLDSVRLVACYGAFGFGYIIPATFLPAQARVLVSDPAVFGWAWPAFGAAAAISTLAAMPLLARFGNRRPWAAAQLLMALGVAAPVLAGGIGAILFAALAVGGTFMVVTMAGMQEARRVAHGGGAGLMAAMTAAFAAGQILGPAFVAALVDAGGSLDAALVAAALALAAAALALIKIPGFDSKEPA